MNGPDAFDPDEIGMLFTDGPPPRARRHAKPPVRFDERTAEQQAHWEGYVARDARSDGLCVAYETRRGGWVLGHVWWEADGDNYFVSLRRTPVFASFDDGAIWLADHPEGR